MPEPAKAASEMLRVRGLRRGYFGRAGIEDVSFDVRGGSVTGFIGVNGAGKSTTLRCVLGLIEPEGGTIELFGGANPREARPRIGFLPEERGLFPQERARDAIAFHARLRGVPKAEARRRADALLDRTGLGSKRDARIEQLSKGNAQRIQILCALAHEPDLLILDEPLSGLDPIGQSEVLSLLSEFAAGGRGVLFSTHSMAAAQSSCDRIVMISRGRTVFAGTLEEAAAVAPNGAILVTADGSALGAAAASLGGAAQPMAGGIGHARRWRVVLPPNVPQPALLSALAAHGVAVHALEPIRRDLEGAFWHLASDGGQISDAQGLAA